MGLNRYGIISIVALIGLAPVAYWVEGSKWAAGYAAATAKVGEMKFLQMLAAGGLFYHLYNQLAYQALEGIDPTTFSVGNTMKRCVTLRPHPPSPALTRPHPPPEDSIAP
jgi:solute carrier family 35 protein E1